MACEITITEVTVTESDGDVAVRITVRGTATDCEKVAVTLKCGVSEYHETTEVVAGTWVVEFVNTRCECDGLVLVDAVCEKDETCFAHTFSGTIDCPRPCPEIIEFGIVEVEENGFPCTDDGKRTVTFRVHIVAGDEDVEAHLLYESINGAQVVSEDIEVGAGGEFEQEYSYSYSAPGPHAPAELIIDEPEGCPSSAIAIPELEECPCPDIKIDRIVEEIAPHCVNGSRQVTLRADISGEDAEKAQWYVWSFDDNTPNENVEPPRPPRTSHSTSHSFQAPGNVATERNVSFAITAFNGRCSYSKVKPITIPGCGGDECPRIARILPLEVDECTDERNRRVWFDAEIEGEGVTQFLWDFGNGVSERIQGAASPRTHEDYETFGPHTVRLTIIGPEGCESHDELTVDISACEERDRDGRGDWVCIASRWAIVIFTIMASLALWIALCVPGAANAFFWLAAGLGAAAAIITVLWLAFCPQPCGWGLLLGWQIALGVGIAALYFANCCAPLWAFGSVSIGGAGYLFAEWLRKCRPTRCDQWAELGVVISVVIIPILGWLGHIPFLAVCMNPLVAAAVGLLGAAVGVGLVKCAHERH